MVKTSFYEEWKSKNRLTTQSVEKFIRLRTVDRIQRQNSFEYRLRQTIRMS